MEDETDLIEVPDDLIEAMDGKPAEEKPEEETKPDEKSQKDQPKAEVEKEEREGEKGLEKEPEPEPWKPKHNPEYYKKKGEKTREHIRDLTTQRYEAQQEAEKLRTENAAAMERIAELEASSNSAASSGQIADLDEALELAREEGKEHLVKVLSREREQLVNPQPRENPRTRETPAEPTPQVAPSAQKWLTNNAWYAAKDDLGRDMYPQLRMEAEQREARLRQSMPMDAELYKELDRQMAQTLEAYGLAKEVKDDPKPDDDPKPGAGLQPNRRGGAERAGAKRDGLSDDEKRRMEFIFDKTGMDPNNPDHRRNYLKILRKSA